VDDDFSTGAGRVPTGLWQKWTYEKISHIIEWPHSADQQENRNKTGRAV
jgi:hypothetical protein